jgi:hypothetical protein
LEYGHAAHDLGEKPGAPIMVPGFQGTGSPPGHARNDP